MPSYSTLFPSVARTVFLSCRLPLRERQLAPLLSATFQQVRGAKSNPQARNKGKAKKDKRGARDYQQKDLKDMQQFTLCDAMRYIRAYEVGREPTVSKYEIHIRMRTKKDGPVIRNMVKFPHPVQTESRICVVCPPGSKHDKEARAAGAVLVGEKEVFDSVKEGKIEFDRLLCHPDSLDGLNKAGLGRILGPRGLMPSVKTGTVVEDVASRVDMLRGGTIYRERDAVVRLPIGQLGFSPEQLRDNLRTTIEQIKKDAALLSDRISKQIYEVVLSSTNGPGLSLNGDFRSESSPESAALTGQ